jgi:hypothetical protein
MTTHAEPGDPAPFRRCAIIGAGLIGSSLAHAARASGAAQTIVLHDADPDVRAEARALNLGGRRRPARSLCPGRRRRRRRRRRLRDGRGRTGAPLRRDPPRPVAQRSLEVRSGTARPDARLGETVCGQARRHSGAQPHR